MYSREQNWKGNKKKGGGGGYRNTQKEKLSDPDIDWSSLSLSIFKL